jgi:hypothetical protein
MIKINFNFLGRDKFNDFIRYLDNIPFVVAEALAVQVAENTISVMQDVINTERKRPDLGTHKLENAIDFKVLVNDPGKEIMLGIGSLDKLAQEAPYWEVLDQGGYVPPPDTGYFGSGNPPIPGGSGETWTHTGDGRHYLMIPKKPIEGIGYIDIGLRNLEKDMNKLIKDFGGKIIAGMGK